MIPTEKNIDTDDFISKSQKKREMSDRQALGEALVGLDRQRLLSLNLPDTLLEAILEAEKIKARGARSRQMQYIGKLMRSVDPEPIRNQLYLWENAIADPSDKLAETWRNRLLSDPTQIDILMAQYPALSRKTLLRLIASAKTEREKNQPPKAFRQLFRHIRDTIRDNCVTD